MRHKLPSWIQVFLIKEEIEEYIAAHPDIRIFEFFILDWEELPIWRSAAAHVSLATEKRIHLIFPSDAITELQYEPCRESG
jgi:hypothetical protein